MELQTISVVSFIGTICSIILSIGFPIMLMIIGNRKFKAKISTFFIGAGTFILFAFVLEQLLHALVIVVLGLNPESNAWLYYVYAAVAAAVVNGRCDEGTDVTVKVRGGDLTVNYSPEHTYLTGPVVKVFEGSFEY